MTYEDGRGILREVVTACARSGFAIADAATDHTPDGDLVRVLLEIHGTSPLAELAATLSDVPGVHAVHAGRASEMFD